MEADIKTCSLLADMFSHHVTLAIKSLGVHRRSSTRCQLSPVSVDMAFFTAEGEGIVHAFIVTTGIGRDTCPRAVARGDKPHTFEVIRGHARHEPHCP